MAGLQRKKYLYKASNIGVKFKTSYIILHYCDLTGYVILWCSVILSDRAVALVVLNVLVLI